MYNSLLQLCKDSTKTLECIEKLEYYINKCDYDINFCSVNTYPIFFEIIKSNNINVLNHLLDNYGNKINKKHKSEGYRLSKEWGHHSISNILRMSELGIDLKNKLKEYEMNNDYMNGMSKLFRHYLMINSTNNYNLIIEKLELTTIDLIKQQKCISQDILRICWDYHYDKILKLNGKNEDILKSKLWVCIENTLNSILDINNVSSDDIGWFWF